MAPQSIGHLFTYLGVLMARPVAFVIFGVYALSWFVFGRDTLEWHGVATLVTWFMTLLIQRAEHRDTQAIHAKLDELLRSQDGARKDLARVDEEDIDEVEKERERAHARAGT